MHTVKNKRVLITLNNSQHREDLTPLKTNKKLLRQPSEHVLNGYSPEVLETKYFRHMHSSDLKQLTAN